MDLTRAVNWAACAGMVCGARHLMLTVRSVAKACVVKVLGSERRPRTILRGPAFGYRFCLSPADNLAYLLGTAEPHLQRIIEQYVAPGDTAYDIGANMGYVSLSLAKKVRAAGSVIAFEPLPENLQLLRQNVTINDLMNVRILDCAASDYCGEAVIRVAENTATASLVWHKDVPTAKQTKIKVVAIDELTAQQLIPPPTFVKIDVEGSEGAVLSGMRRTLARSKPVIFVECSELGRQRAWSLLNELGYQCQSAITRLPIGSLEQYRHSDFLWLPADRPTRRS